MQNSSNILKFYSGLSTLPVLNVTTSKSSTRNNKLYFIKNFSLDSKETYETTLSNTINTKSSYTVNLKKKKVVKIQKPLVRLYTQKKNPYNSYISTKRYYISMKKQMIKKYEKIIHYYYCTRK